MSAMRVLGIFVVVSVAGALLLGAPAHAVVPHEHGGHTHAEESPQWSALHGALRHEEKKDLLFAALIALGVLFLAPRFLQPVLLPRPLLLCPALAPEELRRGTAAYRRFD
jgi:hypothetical protein